MFAIVVGFVWETWETWNQSNLEKTQRETRRQRDAEVLNLVFGDLPDISDNFINHDLKYVPLSVSLFG